MVLFTWRPNPVIATFGEPPAGQPSDVVIFAHEPADVIATSAGRCHGLLGVDGGGSVGPHAAGGPTRQEAPEARSRHGRPGPG